MGRALQRQGPDGWTPKITGYAAGENYNDTFRVENGVLKVVYDKYDAFDGKFGHLFYKDAFSHYRARGRVPLRRRAVQGRPGLGRSATAA